MTALLDQLNTATVAHTQHVDAAQLGVEPALLAELDPAVGERIASILNNIDATPSAWPSSPTASADPAAPSTNGANVACSPPETWTVGGRRAWATSIADTWALLTNRADNLTPPDMATTAAAVPGWADMTDPDRGAALVHMWKRAYHGTVHALEHNPCRYLDHPALVALEPDTASAHAAQVTGGYETALRRLGAAEADRLHRLASEPDITPRLGQVR